jgi:hypothetical protein
MTTQNIFKKATKEQAKLRLALMGVSGSGKTYSALAIASGLGARIALIDTERGSASKYADKFGFDTINLDEAFGNFSPRSYVNAIQAATNAGYDVVVIDSLSHAWIGKGGSLEMHEQAIDRQRVKNSYVAWRDVTPDHNALIDAMIQCKAHLIVTMRSKTEYVQDVDEKGNKQVRKIGLAPVQRDGLEYEFDLVAEMDNAKMRITKSRCPALHDGIFKNPNGQVSDALKTWLTDGIASTEKDPVIDATQKSSGSVVQRPADWKAQVKALGTRAGTFVANADAGLGADISAVQSFARDIYAKNGTATQDEIDGAIAALTAVIETAERINDKAALPA